jgi:membrane protein
MANATESLAERPDDADGAGAEDWRTEVERNAERPIDGDLARARERGRGRLASSPGDFPARGWADIALRVMWSIPADRVLATAGSVAFFALLAVFPAVAVVVSLYGLFADASTIGDHLAQLDGILPDGILVLIREQIVAITSKQTQTLSIAVLVSFGIALWSANSGTGALFDALNVVYGETEKRTLLRFYVSTFLFTIGAAVFVLIAIAGVVVLPVALKFIGVSWSAEMVVRIMRWPILLVFVVLGLATVYRFGPSRQLARWRWVTVGSAAAALLWVGASMLFSWYVSSFDSYNRIYGSLGAGVGFMVWIWVSVVIVLAGAELNAEMEHQTAARHHNRPGAPVGPARGDHGRPCRRSADVGPSPRFSGTGVKPGRRRAKAVPASGKAGARLDLPGRSLRHLPLNFHQQGMSHATSPRRSHPSAHAHGSARGPRRQGVQHDPLRL